jgi:protein-disulfide isomerase
MISKLIRIFAAAGLALALSAGVVHAQPAQARPSQAPSSQTPSGQASPKQSPSDDVLSRDAVLRDPAIPAAGNPNGDITIVEYFDFQCPYCRKAHADLQKLLKEDGKVRVVYKDWPILGEVSVAASRLAMAARFQGKFTQAHDALMNYKGRLTAANLEEILVSAGVDGEKLKADLAANEAVIKETLVRNNSQAEAFGFNATPSFIIGTFRVPGALDLATFKLAIKDARALQKKSGDK